MIVADTNILSTFARIQRLELLPEAAALRQLTACNRFIRWK